MKKNLFWMAAVVLSSVMLSCGSSDEADVNPDEPKQVENLLAKPEPIVLTQEQQQFANDNNGFTLRFLKTVSEADHSGKSFIYSPLSITYVLGMVNDAATGQTEQELEQTLGFHDGGIQAVNLYCKKLIEGLPKVDSKVTLDIANAIFVNKSKAKLRAQYEKDMQEYYNAKAEVLDFSSPKTVGHINGWVEEKTNGMIPTILDGTDHDVMSYLLNAIYFKADWNSKFDPKNTRTETFTTENGTAQLPLMHQNVLICYVKNDTYAAVSIPYGNAYWSMTVMLPEEGKTTDDIISLLAEKGWSADYVNNPMNEGRAYEVDLKLPRFETTSDTNELKAGKGLVGVLQKMGIRQAFDPNLAEIPNMCDLPVYIGMMRQKAAIKVNEEGSEAAAVTVVGTLTSAIGPVEYPKATFHANRPFVYVIRENSSGVILFVGKFTGE
ncbi:MAG: serpin family protein [Prevotella sp.]|nr:serpin family protein [Prevotella sp.]